jgi:hypothetical protein
MCRRENRLAAPGGEIVEVRHMAVEDACEHDMLVQIRWQRRKMAVPLSQLDTICGESTKEAIGLALLGRAGLLPLIYAPPPETHEALVAELIALILLVVAGIRLIGHDWKAARPKKRRRQGQRRGKAVRRTLPETALRKAKLIE